ncbi:BrnT family toxin [Thiobacillus sp.]|mgnify:CR=1 FL=1|jgi:hypothetical protein|uniref:BrnT family toxin n=1 Tax=Thiobacillus sp. TaxID=924 RepID=UPI0025E05DF8|nr:BrnT family toxin [Thiobacillus sp.]
MHIEFDPAKDLANQDKHGVSLLMAAELDWEAALVWVDERIEYGERRMIALAPKTGILSRGLCGSRQGQTHHQPAPCQPS